MKYALSPKFTVIYVLFVSVFMDLLYGILDYYGAGFITVSQLFRMSIILMFVVVVMRLDSFLAWFAKSLMLLWLVSLSVWVVVQGHIPFGADLTLFFRALYPVCITVIIANAIDSAYAQGQSYDNFIYKGVINYGLIASTAIVFSFITGIGSLTYGEWAFGYKSFFTGGNDIGLTILIALIFAWGVFWQQTNKSYALAILLATFGVSLIGSRAAWGGVIGVTLCFSMAFLLFKHSASLGIKMIKITVLVTVLSVSGYVTKLVYDNFDDLTYQVERVTELMEGVSPRAALVKAGYQAIEDRPLVLDVFGQGFSYFNRVYIHYYANQLNKDEKLGESRFRSVEQDFIDLMGVYGVLLGGMLLAFHCYFWLLALRLFWHLRSVVYFCCLMATTLFLFHGLVAGHALMSSQVGTVIGCIYAFMLFKHKRLLTPSVEKHSL